MKLKYVGTYEGIETYACKNENFTGYFDHKFYYLVDNKVLVKWIYHDWFDIGVVNSLGYIDEIAPVKHLYQNKPKVEEPSLEKISLEKESSEKTPFQEKEGFSLKSVEEILTEAVYRNIYDEIVFRA